MSPKKESPFLTGLQIPSYFTRIRESMVSRKIVSFHSIHCFKTALYSGTPTTRIVFIFSIVLFCISHGVLSTTVSGNRQQYDLNNNRNYPNPSPSPSSSWHSNQHYRRGHDRFSYQNHNRHDPKYRHQRQDRQNLAVSINSHHRRDNDLSTVPQSDIPHPGNYTGSTSFFNLASRANIVANATCGEKSGPESFCKLVEHVKSRIPEQIQCGICDDADPSSRHPAAFAIDGSENWWQSPTIANGKDNNYVTITLDLKETYQVAYVIVKAANSPRPGNWILERSIDGINYKPWQYFAISPSVCLNLYGIEPSRGIPKITTDDQVICTSQFSKLEPLENGEIYISLVNGRPGSGTTSQLLKDFTTARYVRLRFQRIHTLYADLMTFVYNDPKDLDPSVTNRYFYSIKDISIGGQCMCAGPGSECIIDQYTGESKCKCQGNLCGKSCDECCPLFNQKPWQPEESACEECNCFGHANSCVYNQTVADVRLSLDTYGEYNGGGVCVDCMDHTMGVNCEMCQDGYFRPSGVDPRGQDSCLPCDCNYIGASGQCVKDDSMVDQGLYAGDCLCNVGYCGPNCDECSPGYTGYPFCAPCPCNTVGSINMDPCAGECVCKSYVCGDTCDKCLPGYFNLRADNPDGCDTCFCFGLSDDCSSSTIPTQCLNELEDWMITDYSGSGTVSPRISGDSSLYVRTEETKRNGLNRALYWIAPKDYIGNKVSSYSGVLEYMFSYKINTTKVDGNEDGEEGYLGNYDVIIEGSGLKIGHNGIYYVENSIHHIAMNLTQDGWKHMEGSSSPKESQVTREDFLTALAGINRLLIRASYHVNQIESSLHGISMDISESGSGPPITSVEMCVCPEGYAGTSCETCAPGYRRIGNVLLGGACVPCDCNGHANQCDPHTGACLDCEHFTEGSNCDRCLPGYARHGGADSCQACACPLADGGNNFAEDCRKTSEGTQCLCMTGYEGSRCERCAPGYYGDPMVPGDYCKPCNCHGNSNPGHDCDQVSGKCKKCQGHTKGIFCDKCEDGYYGTAENGDCKACSCSVYGSVGDSCDHVTGQCGCKPLYTGRDCGKCQEGYGNIAAGCVRCRCNPTGSELQYCDPITGQCQCRPGVGGAECGQCLVGYYGLSRTGCRDCACSPIGSYGTECDVIIGQCNCKPHVTGSRCQHCQVDHWGVQSGKGCQPCNCDHVGSISTQCDITTGQCQCQPAVTGLQCDKCEPGYYGFSPAGCKKCRPCSSPNQVCDPVTGECSCPPNTLRPLCTDCEPNHWGYNPVGGCTPCLCQPPGALSSQCDVLTGQCECTDRYMGHTCDQCNHGYYRYPDCLECGCDLAGTVSTHCRDNRLCQCGNNGQCPCKVNVEGPQCNRCKQDSFMLQEDNPQGCTQCFCSGRIDRCKQAPYAWSLVSIHGNTVTVSYQPPYNVVLNSQKFLEIPEGVSIVYISLEQGGRPLYWNLPSEHLGDWTLSYNGLLRFTVTESTNHNRDSSEDGETVPEPVIKQPPLVTILGNSIVRLQYVSDVSELIESGSGRSLYTVKLREDLWKTEAGRPVTRELLMVALQNVQGMLIKLTDKAVEGTYSISDITLEHAIPVKNGELYNALGIEQCVCPPQYTGLSCQDPATGFYRVRPGVDNVTLTYPKPEDLIGYAHACLCNSHTEFCDPNTGMCINCSDNTIGKHCEYCAPGHYGDARGGTPRDCQQCQCPKLDDQSDDVPSCQTDSENIHGYRCDRCPEGLGGDVCDKCADGFYGNPETDQCDPCQCNPQGSYSTTCDTVTGQCNCYNGIQGKSCDQCSPRHAVQGGTCVPCDVDCTGILFHEVDKLDADLIKANLTASKLLPWKKLTDLEGNIEDLNKLDNIVVKEMPDLEALKANITELKDMASEESIKSGLIKSKAKQIEEEDVVVKAIAEKLLVDFESDLGDLREYITPIVESILERLESGEFNLDAATAEADGILKNILDTNFTMKEIQVDRERRLAESLLEKVKIYQQDHTLDINSTLNGVAEVIDRLKDVLKHTVVVNNVTSQINVINKDTKAQLNNIKQLQSLIETNKTMVLNTHSDGDQINKQAREMLVHTTENIRVFKDLSMGLHFDNPAIEMKVNILKQNIETLRDTVGRAVNHSEALNKQASGLDHLFNDTRETAEDPLNAALSFDKMAEAITEAEQAVNKAADIATNASDVVLNGDKGSLSDQAAVSVVNSEDLRDRAQRNKQKGVVLRQNLEEQGQKLQETYDKHEDTSKRFTKFMDMLNNLTAENRDKISAVKNKTLKTVNDTNVTGDRIREIKSDLENGMKDKVDEMRDYRLEGIAKANASVNYINREMKNINELTVKLTAEAETVKQLGSDIAYDLAKLREQIKQAREQANSIKVSLYHQDSCYRKYKPNLKSATTNSVTLHFKTNDTSKDMLLFLYTTPDSNEYMALEMISKKIRFSWNTGGDTTVINHPLLITTSTGVNELDVWFEVSAERIAHIGILSVRRLSSEFPAEEIRLASTSPSQTLLDVINTTTVFLGGVPNDYQLPGSISATSFSGCIGDVYLDKKPIGLYNFRELIGEGCTGCNPVPASQVTENGMYQFDGTGYASRKQIQYKDNYYVIALKFKVIYKDALLFYIHNSQTRDYVSLALEDGRVVFTYSIQGVIQAQLSTISTYNTNTWVHVDARIVGLVSAMTVDQEKVKGSARDVGKTTMDIGSEMVYFAGVPETIKAYLELYNITSKSFLGCMKDVQLTSNGPFKIDLLEGLYTGMVTGCSSEVSRVVGLDGKGHVELPSNDLPKDGEIILSFRTQQTDALLLLALGTQPETFYSLSVNEGHVEAWFNNGEGVFTIQSPDMYNDGYYHTVTVVKKDRILELYVDDQAAGDTKLPTGDTRITSMRAEGGLYLGGVPSGVNALGTAASLEPLKGCLSDIIIGQKLLTLDLPVAYNKADIGRCDTDELFSNITGDKTPKPGIPSFTVTVKRPQTTTTTAPPKPDPTSCAFEGGFARYDNAVAFGDVKNSHAKVVVKRRSLTKDFNITMEFRTFYKKGLMVYITNAGQTEYFAVEMINGKVLVSYEGKNLGKALQTQGDSNDGNWHKMRVSKKERTISVQVDLEDPLLEKISRKLDVDAPVYVGGLPKEYRPREGLISESFKGCIRDFTLNGELFDPASSVERVKGISKCYKHAERGAYFDGFGYAIFAENYVIKSEFSINLYFRTIKTNGLILTISSPRGMPALTLEMFNGEIVYTAINPGGKFSAKSNKCPYCLCDNEWHHVKAELIKNVVTLEVDDSPTVGVSEGYERFLNTDTSLYIGGYAPYDEYQAAANTREFFIGCIRDMKLNGKEINYHSMHNLIDVHVGACPISLE